MGHLSAPGVTILSRTFLVLKLKVLYPGKSLGSRKTGMAGHSRATLCHIAPLTQPHGFPSFLNDMGTQFAKTLEFYNCIFGRDHRQHPVSPGWESQLFPWASVHLEPQEQKEGCLASWPLSQNSFWKIATQGRMHPGRLQDLT